jgi:hypothetical protein
VLLGDDEERAAAAAAATARKSEFFVIVLAGASHRPLRAAVLFFSWFGIFHLRFGCERLKMDGPWGIFSISIFFSLLSIRFPDGNASRICHRRSYSPPVGELNIFSGRDCEICCLGLE